MSLSLNPSCTALVVIDPQVWTLGMPLSPHTGDVVARNASRLAKAIGQAGAVIVTRAAFSPGYADMIRSPVDIALNVPEGGIPEAALAFHPAFDMAPTDVVITKRQWSAFYATELDLQLRRRGITSLVIAGVMTNFGVESTARDAWQHNYAVIVAEDACSSLDPDMHHFAITNILPRVSRVRSTDEIINAIGVV